MYDLSNYPNITDYDAETIAAVQKFPPGSRVQIISSDPEDCEPMDDKYVGKEGLVKGLTKTDLMLTVHVPGIGEDAFFPEELKLMED